MSKVSNDIVTDNIKSNNSSILPVKPNIFNNLTNVSMDRGSLLYNQSDESLYYGNGETLLKVVGEDADGNIIVNGGLITNDLPAAPIDPTGTTTGVIWSKTGTPNTLYFTNNEGVDVSLSGTTINPFTFTPIAESLNLALTLPPFYSYYEQIGPGGVGTAYNIRLAFAGTTTETSFYVAFEDPTGVIPPNVNMNLGVTTVCLDTLRTLDENCAQSNLFYNDGNPPASLEIRVTSTSGAIGAFRCYAQFSWVEQ